MFFCDLLLTMGEKESAPCAEGKGDGKGANRSGTNGALERQGDRRSSAVPKLGGLPPQATRHGHRKGHEKCMWRGT